MIHYKEFIMKESEITKIILILKDSYPYAFKDMGEQEVESMVGLYREMFKNCEYKEVLQAVKDIINTSEYMPTIAAIKNKIYENNHPNELDNSELWEKLLTAIRNGNYHAEDEFEKLPPLLKIYVRNPRQLQEFAIMNSDVIHSVVKGQFLKQIETIKENYKEIEITGKKNLLTEKGIYQIEEVID